MAKELKIKVDVRELLRKEFQGILKATAVKEGRKTFPVFIYNCQSLPGKYIEFLEERVCDIIKTLEDDK